MSFTDYYWPVDAYRSAIEKAGFIGATSRIPRLDLRTAREIAFLQSEGVFPDVDYEALIDETPTAIVRGRK